jgi:glutamyl-tRNA synthetase
MPREGSCRFTDLIRGDLEFEWAREQDHVVQRADGTCLYHLASVVDDHEMRISHVIRAEEHLPNTPRQLFIAAALGYEPPQHAHLPVVAEPGSRTKLSKRKLTRYLKHAEFAKLHEHGRAVAAAAGLDHDPEAFNPLVTAFYEQVGYLPEALLNYLLLLGWSLDDRTERFTREEMIRAFSLERVNRAPASFDPGKLLAFQERRMQELPPARRAALALPFLERAGLVPDPPPPGLRERLEGVVAAAGDRLKVAGDVLDYAGFFVDDERLAYDEAAFDKRLRRAPQAAALLRGVRERLAAAARFDPPALEDLVREFAREAGVDLPAVVHPLRVAVTGKPVGFGLYDALALLGRERCLARIDRALARL